MCVYGCVSVWCVGRVFIFYFLSWSGPNVPTPQGQEYLTVLALDETFGWKITKSEAFIYFFKKRAFWGFEIKDRVDCIN